MAESQPTRPVSVGQVRGKPPVDLDSLRRHVNEGGTLGDFASLVGLHENTVRRLCHLNGIPTKVWKPHPMTPAECAWVAACLDCEGCISLHIVPNKKRRSRNVQVAMRVHMTCDLVPARLKAVCGGSLAGPIERKQGHRPTWLWCLGPNGCRYVLPQILPYLLTKKRRAEIALLVLEGNRHGHSMPNEQLIPLVEEMRRLNARGVEGHTSLEELRPASAKPDRSETVECACGCGGTLRLYDERNRTRRFLHGHNGRQAVEG